MMMKYKFLFLLILIPFITFSQSEVEDKTRKRNERFNPPTSNDNTTIIVPNTTPTLIYPYYNRYTPYNPYVPYNTYSYRSNVYNPMVFSMGMTTGFGKYPMSLGGYLTVGSENAFVIMFYEVSERLPYDRGNKDNRILWDNITRDESLFWGDEELDRFLRYSSFNIGVGGNLSDSFSPFVCVDFYVVDGEFVFYDETGALQSPNNEYTIHDKYEEGINLRFGTFYNINSVNIGTSLSVSSPIRVNTSIGFTF